MTTSTLPIIVAALALHACGGGGGQPAPAGITGEWTVSSWTATRSLSNTIPGDDAGWTESPQCAALADGALRTRSLRLTADGGATVNERECVAQLAASPIRLQCPCGNPGAQVCSLDLTLRLDDGGQRLVGEERLVFSYSSPPYCDVRADLVARRGAP